MKRKTSKAIETAAENDNQGHYIATGTDAGVLVTTFEDLYAAYIGAWRKNKMGVIEQLLSLAAEMGCTQALLKAVEDHKPAHEQTGTSDHRLGAVRRATRVAQQERQQELRELHRAKHSPKPKQEREHKTVKAIQTKVVDAAQGIVKAFFAVFGNVDLGADRIWPGAFVKTFTERGLSVKVLDAHRTDSGLAAIGRPLELREVGIEELPSKLLEEFPDAVGAAEATVQFLMDTPEGSGIFKRLAEGIIDQWSFAYDTITRDFSEEVLDGKNITVRNLRELRLHEISPVLFGMNSATTTTAAKADAEAEEAKPWAAFPIADEFCVFRIDDQHEREGDSLGCHDTLAAAEDQVAALFASEEDAGKADDTSSEEKATNLSEHVSAVRSAFDNQFNMPNGPWDWWARDVFDEFVVAHHSGDKEETFQIPYTMDAEGVVTFAPRVDWVSGSFQFIPDNAPASDVRAAETDQDNEKAGPSTTPTSEMMLAEVNVMLAEIQMELLEV